MMKLADLDGVLIETSKDALCHQFDVIDTGWQLETVQLGEFLITVIITWYLHRDTKS